MENIKRTFVTKDFEVPSVPKIYRKSVLHMLKYRFAVYLLQMQYKFALNFRTLSTSVKKPVYSSRINLFCLE